MKVFKLGGASIDGEERIRKTAEIIRNHQGDQLVVVISAMGKTTNALENIAEAFFSGQSKEAFAFFELVKQAHLNIAKSLLVNSYAAASGQLLNFFTEMEWLLHDKAVKEYDYYYDQIVCIGELLSSCIVSAYMNEAGITNKWLDVRDLLRTDDTFRVANVVFDVSRQNIVSLINQTSFGIYITQGFIGSTDENESTTLGREGSDYSAAVFANILDAESLTIWKDVEGVMSADPKQFFDAALLKELSYNEVIEMSYYGAQVIHPKTIQPLQNKNIPLFVKSFIDPSLPGTVISNTRNSFLPPIIIIKENQALMQLNTRDFSFAEKSMNVLYTMLDRLNIRSNLLQTGAISIQICIDDQPGKIDHFASHAGSTYDVAVQRGLTLLTIRHYNDDVLKMIAGKQVVLMQKTKEIVQVLYEENVNNTSVETPWAI